MRPRTLKRIVSTALILTLAGCNTARKGRLPTAVLGPETRMLGKLAVQYPVFRTLEEMKNELVEGYGPEAGLYAGEMGGVKVAVCVQLWGGYGYNAALIYAFDEVKRQWSPRGVWNTGVRGVKVVFNKRNGIFEADSGAGRLIFEANVSALAARESEQPFLGKSGVGYPSLRTFEELKAAAQRDGRLYAFEKGDVKVGVREQSWDEGSKVLIIYTWDEIGDQWSARVIWDTGAKDVRVTFGKSTGVIETHSGAGKLIFRANIEALRARQSLFD